MQSLHVYTSALLNNMYRFTNFNQVFNQLYYMRAAAIVGLLSVYTAKALKLPRCNFKVIP